MKKVHLRILSSLLIFFTFISSPSVQASPIQTTSSPQSINKYALNGLGARSGIDFIYDTVETPMGSNVPVYHILSDYSVGTIASYNTNGDSFSNTDTRLYTATAYFNCHSYAWHSQNTDENHYWMDSPVPYYTDGSYYEVSTPAVGDIICYFDDNESSDDTNDDRNLHSGIVVSVLSGTTSNNLCGSANTVIVESKWGRMGLYRHNGYECPYTDRVLTFDASTEERNIADYVKYYRRTGHSHSFTTYNDTGRMDFHECICSCGMTIHAPHIWVEHWGKAQSIQNSAKYIPQFYCSDCGAFTLNP